MLPRLIQTTIASISSEYAISTIFVPVGEIDPGSRTHEENLKAFHKYLRDLNITNIIGLPLIRREMPGIAGVLISDFNTYFTEVWLADMFFDGEYTASQDLVSELLQTDIMVVEQSLPTLKSLLSFLEGASGVAIGAFVGIVAAATAENPILMFITVPAGMLIVGPAAGIATALERGLRDKLLNRLKK